MRSHKIPGTELFMELRRRKRIKLRNNAMRPLSEEEIVDATVAFANGASIELLDLVDPLIDPFEDESEEAEARTREPCVGDRALEIREIRFAASLGNEPRTIGQMREDARQNTRENLQHRIRAPMSPQNVEELSNMDLF